MRFIFNEMKRKELIQIFNTKRAEQEKEREENKTRTDDRKTRNGKR